MIPVFRWSKYVASSCYEVTTSGIRYNCSSIRYSTSASLNNYNKTNEKVWKNSPFISTYASMPITPVTLDFLLDLELDQDVIANYVHHELPIRLARRLRAIEKLPYIVGVNPFIAQVYQLYSDSFHRLIDFPSPSTPELQTQLANTLSELTESHQTVIPNLAQGFMECGKYMSVDKKQEFLDYMIHARIGIRVLAEHFLSLKNNSKNTIGIVNLAVDPVAIVSGIGHYVQQLCDLNYGSFPEFEIVGDRQARFAYIDVHLEYILMEIIKNAMRATVEESERLKRLEHPPIEICISTSKDDIIFRFRDQGGGIPLQHQSKIWEYSFTTVKKDDDMDFLSSQARLSMQQATGGPIAGLGFGLPMSRVYAKYFGGMLDVRSVAGYGSDVFLRFPNITKFQSTVQI